MPDRRFAHQIPRTALLGALALAVAAPASALEIDGLEVHSSQGHPLHARARITGPGSENPLRTAVRCLEGACADAQLRSYVAGRAQQAPAVVVRSFSPLRSSFLRIEVEVADGTGIARREFTLQLRPSGESRRAVSAPAVAAAAPVSLRAAPGTATGDVRLPPPRGENLPLPAAPAADADGAAGDERWVVQPGQTLSGIAAQISRRHGGGTSVWMERLFAGNPDAFIRADRNRIRAGATLRFDLPRAGIAEAAPSPLPAPSPEPQPVAPKLPATAPVSAAGTGVSSAAAARDTLAELSDDGKALADRLARLEARIRSLQAELASRESAIEELQQEASAPAQAMTSAAAEPESVSAPTSSIASAPSAPVAVAVAPEAAPVNPAGVEAGAAAAAATGSDGPVAPTAIAAPAIGASAKASEAGSPDLTPVADEQFTRFEPPATVTPARLRVDWTLTAALGLVVVVLGLALLLRRLSRSSQAASQPLRRDDRALKAQIQERLESADAQALAAEAADEGIDMARVSEAVAGTKAPTPAEDTVRLEASPLPAGGVGEVNEDEVVTEVDVKIVYGLFDEAETVLMEALAAVPLSPRLLLKLAEVRFYRRDAEALAELATQVLAQGHRQPAWLWAKVERLGRELCPERPPFAQSPARPGLRSVG